MLLVLFVLFICNLVVLISSAFCLVSINQNKSFHIPRASHLFKFCTSRLPSNLYKNNPNYPVIKIDASAFAISFLCRHYLHFSSITSTFTVNTTRQNKQTWLVKSYYIKHCNWGIQIDKCCIWSTTVHDIGLQLRTRKMHN
jgi:hypothetical protein